MAKIKLTRGESIEVSVETAERVLQEWAIDKKPIIEVNGVSLRNSRITDVDKSSDQNKSKEYNISNPEDVKILEEFSQELENAKKQELDENVEFYGDETTSEIKHTIGPKAGKTTKYDPPLVSSSLFNLEHPEIVKYLLDNEIITRTEQHGRVYWAVGKIQKYNEYINKRSSLGYLNAKNEFVPREYLEQQDILKDIPF